MNPNFHSVPLTCMVYPIVPYKTIQVKGINKCPRIIYRNDCKGRLFKTKPSLARRFQILLVTLDSDDSPEHSLS